MLNSLKSDQMSRKDSVRNSVSVQSLYLNPDNQYRSSIALGESFMPSLAENGTEEDAIEVCFTSHNYIEHFNVVFFVGCFKSFININAHNNDR